MNPRIRRVVTDQEFDAFHQLFVAYELDLPPQLRHGTVPGVAALRTAYSGENAAFVAWVDGSASGCVAVMRLDAERALLQRLFVQPDFRGRGLARALVLAALERAGDCGYGRVVLDTNKEQLSAAYALYRSVGFTECEPFATVTYECPTFMALALGQVANPQALSRRSDSNR